MKVICRRFHIVAPFTIEISAFEICEKFVYKHSETTGYLLVYFLKNSRTSRINISSIFRINNAKYAGYCFYMNTDIYGLCTMK